ncbi:MAG: Low affinity potassium transport system protein kup [Steroidobacteraceae bacterium]|nr:Low affinity potassium transport system protein kup [Steroidobacteraceae bacterium]
MSESRPVLPALIGALGVVFGDIGTSPLYALKVSLDAAGAPQGDAGAVLGVLSLITWSLFVVVTLKYVTLMLRADNQGEGGILALFSLVQKHVDPHSRSAVWVAALALAGAALFYCDALITPAITVLSAVEGMELLDPGFARAVIPVTLGILIALFAIQRRGTERVGRLFGPIMLLWFLTLGVSGFVAILRGPLVLAALDPRWAIVLLVDHPGLGFAILGAVFLALTGGEALYADMGHFGKRPVRAAWFWLVWPALMLNYYGQGAQLLAHPASIAHPLYFLVPQALLPLLVLLATAASVIASQAVITGTFSVTRQAVQLDLLPRVRVLQTSALEHGQIFVPVVNALLLIAVSGFVFAFGSSDALSGAYGAAVVGTMFVTTLLGAIVGRTEWRWSLTATAAVFGTLLLIDAAFVLGNMTKLDDGGWVPVALATVLFGIFWTWREGRLRLRLTLARHAVPIDKLPQLLEGVTRVPGTAIFLASHPGVVPSALIRNLEYNHVVHERIVILNLSITGTPRQEEGDRVRIETLQPGVLALFARFGFMETPDVQEALRACRQRGLRFHAEDVSWFLGLHLVRPRPRTGLPGLRMRLFAWMQRRSTQAAEFFNMPSRGVMVVGTELEV